MAAPPIEDLKGAYGNLKTARDEAMRQAESAAELTMPWLRVKGPVVETRPWTHLGTQAVRSLGANVHHVMMPPQSKWLRLDVLPQERAALHDVPAHDAQGQPVVDPETGAPVSAEVLLDHELARIEDDILETIAANKTRSRVASAIQRNLVEGSNAGIVDSNSVRFVPLRRHVVFRDGGTPRFLIVQEEHVSDPYDTSPIQSEETRQYLYSLADFDSGDVWQQVEEERITQVDAKASQYFVMSGSIPDVDHYPTSYVYEHLSLIRQLNHASQRMAEAMAIAAWNVPLIDPSAPVTPEELQKSVSSKPLVCPKDLLSWFTSNYKLADWHFVAEFITTLSEQLAHIFAFGIKDRSSREATATEILQIAGELDTHTTDLMAAYEETLQRSLVVAVMAVRGYDTIRGAFSEKPLRVIITSGQNALQRETSMNRLLNTAVLAKQLDPLLTVDGVELMKRAGDVLQFDNEGLFSRAQPQGQAQPGAPPPGQQMAVDPRRNGAGGPQPPQPKQRKEMATGPVGPRM